jgi:hypothetical protein
MMVFKHSPTIIVRAIYFDIDCWSDKKNREVIHPCQYLKPNLVLTNLIYLWHVAITMFSRLFDVICLDNETEAF